MKANCNKSYADFTFPFWAKEKSILPIKIATKNTAKKKTKRRAGSVKTFLPSNLYVTYFINC